ncbi:hypothetical protein BCR44DRAFT_1431977 [Catenaria anguillulae PL171]|uniref:FAD-binding domain-containing protein n=1 Tax=Catenaria anguillulae PL171 TaxID=765915 RepID=A0A1Y2HSK0_9FUNG|nr:hypothetical protein BCR44DRAFT_1431977 [Catenaria anguillulae PL171]
MPSHSPFTDLTAHIFPPPEFAIVGGGVGGLAVAALFERYKIPYVILEKRKEGTHLDGADLGLFPAAIDVLVELGVPDEFWTHHSSRVEHVHVCKARHLQGPPAVPGQDGPTGMQVPNGAGNGKVGSMMVDGASIKTASPVAGGSEASSSTGFAGVFGGHSRATTAGSATSSVDLAHLDTIVLADPIKSLNMENVLGTGQCMRMTNRRSLMSQLMTMVPREKILFESSVIQCTENDNHVELVFTYQHAFASLVVPMVIGADGIKSVCRQLTTQYRAETLAAAATDTSSKPSSSSVPNSSPRYAGEICYRGSFPLPQEERAQREDANDPAKALLRRQLHKLMIKDDFHKPRSMSLYYDKERRFSFGFLNEIGSYGYWWVREKWQGSREAFKAKQLKREGEEPPAHWPEPLQSMFRLTRADHFYLQPIVDREADSDPMAWYSARCVLLGDAAHPTTPALFQGANMAIEDAHLLVRLIVAHGPAVKPTVLFDQFARTRIKHVSRIQRESFRQTKVSQWQSKTSTLLRDAALKIIPTKMIEGKLRKASAWDPDAAVREALSDTPAGSASVAKPVRSVSTGMYKKGSAGSVTSGLGKDGSSSGFFSMFGLGSNKHGTVSSSGVSTSSQDLMRESTDSALGGFRPRTSSSSSVSGHVALSSAMQAGGNLGGAGHSLGQGARGANADMSMRSGKALSITSSLQSDQVSTHSPSPSTPAPPLPCDLDALAQSMQGMTFHDPVNDTEYANACPRISGGGGSRFPHHQEYMHTHVEEDEDEDDEHVLNAAGLDHLFTLSLAAATNAGVAAAAAGDGIAPKHQGGLAVPPLRGSSRSDSAIVQ